MSTVTPSSKRQMRDVVELRWDCEAKQVVAQKGDDRVAMPVRQAIDACRAYADQITFKEQFDLLTNRICRWSSQHEDSLHEVYLTARDSGLLFLAVTNTAKYNDGLEESLTDLDLDIANDEDYNLIDLGCHAIPKAESCDLLGAFLSKKFAIRFTRNAE